ncbi:FAD/NAD(P)-binding protein [Mesorhizobium sp. M1409]|uniref:FAD/NAD(P)-binding protein n=1 Tax=unclassified Mesorhizobium TaxID=325217 RepID=UPI00333AAAA2
MHWLRARNIQIDDPTTYFAPRRLYGRYLGQLLHETSKENGSYGRLRIIDEECVGIVERDEYLELADGSSVVTQRCVLATGHDQKASRSQSLLAQSGGR